jgi:hypothetical protein
MSDDQKPAELWPTMTMSAIGDQLSVSRSAIAGRVARARQAGSSQFPPKPHVGKVKPIGEVVGNQRPEPPAPKPSPSRLLVDLGWHDCRMAVSTAADGRHLFCGKPQIGRGPYCSECLAKVSVSRPLAAGQTR